MSLKGNIKDFDLADIIQMIGRNRKTGKLIISGAENYVTIYFKDGHAVFASPAHQRDYLGNILIRRGVVSRRDVEEALSAQRKLRKAGQNIRIGAILAANGAISKETLEKFITIQIQETVIAALTEKSGGFEFVPEMELDDADILVTVDPEWVILESTRQLDEWDRVGERAPAPGTVFIINPDPEVAVTMDLGMDEWRLISLINGLRTVEEVVNSARTSRLTALRTLSNLVELKVIVKSQAGNSRKNSWNLVPDAYRPPSPPTKNILGRIIDRIKGM